MRTFNIYNIAKFLAIGLLVMTVNQSCTDLDEELFDVISADNFFQTEEELQAGFAEAYARLAAFANHGNYFSIQEVASDEVMIPQRGGDWFDGGLWLRVHRHEYTATEDVVTNVWGFGYKGVNLCNSLIEALTVNEADPALISELRVLRAFYTYLLMDVYGNIPIISETGIVQPTNNSRAEVYAFIENEVTAALPNLSREPADMYGRFHYYAAQALLAKLYINAEVYTGTAQWSKAEAACDEILDSGKFELENNYFANFNADNDLSKELILSIPYDRVNLRGFNLGQMTLHYSSQQTFNLEAQPWNGYCSLAEFYNSYDDSDTRKGVYGDQSVRGNFHAGPQYSADGVTPLEDAGYEKPDPDDPSKPFDPDGIELVFTPEINEHFPNALRQAGVRIGKYEFLNGATPELDNDFPLFRMGDIQMIKAEALWRLNKDLDVALMLVNEIRGRANQPDFSELNTDNLLAERGREMFAETWRRQDLIRFGKYGDPWQFKPASNASKEIYPIPKTILDVNPNLNQNDGY